MFRKPVIITILFFIGIACCNKKSSRLSFHTDAAAVIASLQKFAAEKNYDSVIATGKQAVNDYIAQQKPDSAMFIARKVCDTALVPDDAQPAYLKNYLLFLFDKKNVFETDTAAIKKFYNLFTWKYYLFQQFTYDPQFVEMADHFILLAKKFPYLKPDRLSGFKQALGIIYNTSGDLKKATGYYKDVYEMDKAKKDIAYIPSSVLNICIALNEWGKQDSSLNLIRETLDLGISDHYDLAGLYIMQGEAHLRNNHIAEAQASIEKAKKELPLIEDQGRLEKRNFECLSTSVAIQNSLASGPGLITTTQKALYAGIALEGTYRSRTIGKILLQLGAAYKKNNRPDSALWYYHQALYTVAQVDSGRVNSLPVKEAVYAENTIMDALDSMAVIWDEFATQKRFTGYLQNALEARKLAFIVERKLFEAFSYDESMTAMLRYSKRRSGAGLLNCYTLWQVTKEKKWLEEAFLLNENSKAIILLNSVKRNNALGSLQETDSILIALNRARMQSITLEKSLIETTDTRLQDSIRKEIAIADDHYIGLETQGSSKYPFLKRSGVDSSTITFAALQEKILRDNDCLLQYFVTDSNACIMWLDRSGNSGMQWLSATDLQPVRDFLNKCVLTPDTYEKDRAAFNHMNETCTGVALPAYIRQSIGENRCKKIVLIPDGIFSLLPFDALMPVAGEFLVKRCTVFNGFSISTLLSNNSVHTGSSSAVVFTPFSEHGHHKKTRLSFSKKEADAMIRSRSDVQLYNDTSATVKQFREALPRYDIIHIASHASANNKEEPCIYFSDAILPMKELYASATNASLIVLNGCETGIGEMDPTEGPLSLARGFYYAGAKNVINSLWSLDDAPTAEIFTTFYQDYRPGQTGAALHQAKLEYLSHHSGGPAAPCYWAGLVHVGLDKPAAKKKGITPVVWISGAAVTALLLFAGIRLRRRKARSAAI